MIGGESSPQSPSRPTTTWQAWRTRLQRSTDAERLRQHEDKVLLVLTLVIGAIVSLVISGFILITENLGERLYPGGGAWERRLLVPTLGALVSGFLLARYFPDARGSGIPQTKAAMFLRDGFISFRTVVGKFACSSLSLASGIALGREGPSVQVGAGIASSLGRRLGLGPARIKTLVPIGASAALAAAFNTPIAAVLFSLEEVMGDLHAPVLGSIVLSSATSWMVLHLLLGDEPLFHVPAYQLVHPVEFVVYAGLGLVGGLVSVAFVKLLLGIRQRFVSLPAATVWAQPAAGGVFVGLLGVFVPAVLGVGYAHVGEALNGKMAIGTMALLLGLKLVATAACYGTGNAGGIFGPSLFLGAMMGGAVGGAVHYLLPDYTGGVGAYALVGMGAAFAGIVRVPMTSVIMIFEITRDYTIIVPLMIANLVSYFVSSRFQPVPIYEALQLQEGVRLPARREQRENLLKVAQAMRPGTDVLWAGESVRDGIARISQGGREADPWLVMDGKVPVGSVTLADLRRAQGIGRGDATVASVVVERGRDGQVPVPVYPDQPADSALWRLEGAFGRALPVTARGDTSDVVGSVSVPGILAAYARAGAEEEAEGASSDTASPRLLLAGVAATVALLLVLSGGLAYRSRGSRLERGREALATGNTLMQQQRTQEAIQHFRLAVSQLRSTDARRALGLALEQAGVRSEAEIYLKAVLDADAADGAANLGLARIAVARGDIDSAATYYERAIVGHWAERPASHRLDAGFEFVDVLSRSGDKARAVAELLRLASMAGEDWAARARSAASLDRLGAYREAADLWSALARAKPGDVQALVGLGQARFALADYPAALAAFRQAREANPSNEVASSRLALCEDVVNLDPTAGRLGASDRHRRSLALLKRTLASVEDCLGAPPAGTADDEVGALAETVRARLRAKRRPPSLSDATDDNVRLAEDLWRATRARCPAATPDDPVALVLARLTGAAPRAGQ